MLLSYQKDNLEKLSTMADKNTDLTIVGKKNSGRKYVIKQWSQCKKNPLIIYFEKTGLDYEYATLVSALKKFCRLEKNKIIVSPNIGITVSALSFGIGVSFDKEDIFKSENFLKKCLRKLTKKFTLIFIIDNDLCITDKSIEFLESFITKYNKKKTIHRFTLSTNQIAKNECVFFESLSNSKLNKLETLRQLNLNPEISLDEKVIEFIFQNVSDNIELLHNIIRDINSNYLDYNFERYDVNNLTELLIDEGFSDYQYQSLLKKVLNIYAISPHCFQYIDLAFMMQQTEYVIKLLLDFALNHYLIEGNAQNFHIIFGLVKKIFGEIDEISKHHIYMDITNMFSNIYPSDYYNKYFFAQLARSPEHGTYLVQYIMQKVRLNHNIDISDYEDIIKQKEVLIIETYNCAFGLLSCKKYDDCILKLEDLHDLSGALLYEINILKSQCLIRKIDNVERNKALDLLSYNDNNEAIDENLKYRLDIRKIAASVHVGKYHDALQICNDITERLLQMYSKTNSLEYLYYLNVIYRKYSYVCSYDLSIKFVEKSVDFFKTHKKIYYKAYYISLNNLMSLYIINMDLKKAGKIKQEIDRLILSKSNINFPRAEIRKNNDLLYDYFSEKASKQITMQNFKKLYEELQESADHILIASNYAVFMMLNNNLEKARTILLKEHERIKDEQEGIYHYRITTNLSVCEFLLDNNKRAECIKRLNNIKYNQEDPHYQIRNQELNGIIELMTNISGCTNTASWCEAYKDNISTPFNYYTTYQQGLIFTTLFDWDDD